MAKKHHQYYEGHRNRLLKRRYGISHELYLEMADEQGYRCKLCQRKPSHLVVDHDHDSGVVRGLLCTKCNLALGAFGDNPVKLQRAINYLMNGGEV